MDKRGKRTVRVRSDKKRKKRQDDIINEGVVRLLIEEYLMLRKKSRHFLKIYPKLVKTGFLLIFTVPILFMVLMFTVNAKLIFLVLWIISILVIAGYLIGIEYFYFYYKNMHEKFERARHPENYIEEEQLEEEAVEEEQFDEENEEEEQFDEEDMDEEDF